MPTNTERLAGVQEELRRLHLPSAAEFARLAVEERDALPTPLRFVVDVSEVFPAIAGESKEPVTFNEDDEDPLRPFEQLIRSVPNRITNGERISIGRIDRVFEEILKTLRR